MARALPHTVSCEPLNSPWPGGRGHRFRIPCLLMRTKRLGAGQGLRARVWLLRWDPRSPGVTAGLGADKG